MCNMVSKNTRRQYLKISGTAAIGLGMAGCAGDESGSGTDAGDTDDGGSGGDTSSDSSGGSRDFFKLGVVTSLSGDLRFGGNVTKRGYDLWADTLNQQGGIEIGGEQYDVQLEYADAQSKPSAGASAASRMINEENVDAVLGPFSSNVTLAVCPIMEQNSMPHITGSAESPEIWAEGYEYSFGTIPTVSIIGREAAAALLSLDPQPESVYITGVNEPFSKATAESMRTASEEAGVEIESFELFPRDTDYSNVISQAKSAEPDIHFHGGHIGSSVKLVNAAQELDYNPDGFMVHYGMNSASFKDGVGNAAPYSLGATVWLPQIQRSGGVLFDTPQDYADASVAAFDTAPDYTQGGSTAAGVVYQQALTELGSAPPLSQEDKDELINILEEVDIDTFYGNISFDTEGEFYHDNTNTQPLLIQLDDTNEAQIVGPAEEAVSEATYPIPTWSER